MVRGSGGADGACAASHDCRAGGVWVGAAVTVGSSRIHSSSSSASRCLYCGLRRIPWDVETPLPMKLKSRTYVPRCLTHRSSMYELISAVSRSCLWGRVATTTQPTVLYCDAPLQESVDISLLTNNNGISTTISRLEEAFAEEEDPDQPSYGAGLLTTNFIGQ
ncbi:hypothetical protein J6590_041782 [Homalodisca vitripennis]|nr:hypothetical protein J6590_041782 [Homalodisca vitripennis]